MSITAQRFSAKPIIHQGQDRRLGDNINGPSVIRVPDWIANPLGRYYLYFAHHKGTFIRLAFADHLEGPWQIHGPGCLSLAQSGFCTQRPSPPGPRPDWAADGQDWLYPHIASPDVIVDNENKQIRLYYHGLLDDGDQLTRVALSPDGLSFTARPDILGPPYLRAFPHDGQWYAVGYQNQLLRSPNGLRPFAPGPAPLDPMTRHVGVLRQGARLHVVWTRIGANPETIYHATMDLTGDWRSWQLSDAQEILCPELPWEGGHLPDAPSGYGAAEGPVKQLRDPFIFQDGGRYLLFYAGAGEQAIGLAALNGL